VLESFLDRAVTLKEDRLTVLDGINRLDDIARGFETGTDLTDEVGGWFAEHNRWLEEPGLRLVDRNKIGQILGAIRHEIGGVPDATPARNKIVREIDRWDEQIEISRQKLTMKRGPESSDPDLTDQSDSIALFHNKLRDMASLSAEIAQNKQHVLSILDDSLKSATLQQNRDALLLSAFIIYYLKLNRYKVDPYVKRLKEAERLQAGGEE
jgi:hypothetical protein